jgi:cobalt-precorrin-5B (C1)-methyltransferase
MDPSSLTTRAGYTLPVFACASALAALQRLQQPETPIDRIRLDLLEPAETVEIAIEQVAPLPDGSVLAISRSDPGDNLDLTRHTPIWAVVGWGAPDQTAPIQLCGGEGVGRRADGQPAINAYAQRLLQTHLGRQLQPHQKIQVTIILPAGRALATRTSNAAFGVVEGLSLLGTTGLSQPLSAPGQLEAFRAELQAKAQRYDTLVFCIGENGLDLALQLGINPEQRLKTANWIGPLLIEAALQGIRGLLLFGYHGKLMKLAGGIFHTHHHVADGRQEILAAHCANEGLPTDPVQHIFASPTTEAGLAYLRQWDQQQGSDWVTQVYGAIAARIDQRTQHYIYTHSEKAVTVGTVLFDRRRQIIIKSLNCETLLPWVC